MNSHPFDLPPVQWLGENPRAEDAREILGFLTSRGTFQFPTVGSGLFSAAAAENPEFRLTGYQNVWTRDNCHIAHALWATGRKAEACRAAEALLTFYGKYEHKFIAIITGQADAGIAANRPHIRFDGDTLTELDVSWAHAQNDALGYTLWLICKLALAGDLRLTDSDFRLLERFAAYFEAIQYWQDEDSGHWEETRKIEASSIGPVVAGLRLLQKISSTRTQRTFPADRLRELISQGEQALQAILPAECIQANPAQSRRDDAALIFLIWPLEVVDDDMAVQILGNVCEQLTGPIGIRRYNGDSYWCANYRDLLAPEVRTTDFSDDMSARDALLQRGEEAQWCIFDPIVSVIHGRRWWQTRSNADRQLQLHHLRRSLAQLTTAESRFPAFRCPESYFLEHGQWIPNDITPLLWTQANLLLALHELTASWR